MDADRPPLSKLRRCFDGRVPAVIATASADGIPNVTYLSAVHPVDDERVALSNQFMSKTSRNLAENPQASLLLIDPVSFEEYRLAIRYERTERRGPVFDRLRDDVDRVAAMTGMRDVFRLRSADIYRVVDVEVVVAGTGAEEPASRSSALRLAAVAELTARLSRCPDLDSLVDATVRGLDDLLGFRHVTLLLLDETGTRLYTIASHGFAVQGVGSEVPIGEGVIGMAAERCAPVRVGNLRQMGKYSQSVRRSFEEAGDIGPGWETPVPSLPDVESRMAVPAIARGQLVGVLAVESHLRVAFDEEDEALLGMVASLVANAVEIDRVTDEGSERRAAPRADVVPPGDTATQVRFFPVDGSVFLGTDYLIRGVAGRVLWSLLNAYVTEGRVEFSTKEVRLDPSLELPSFRDNLDTRIILLKRRLEEREAPVRIEKTGRGRFRVDVDGEVRLQSQ